MQATESRARLMREIAEQDDTSVVRDQWLIPTIFRSLHGKDVHPIVSEGFIYKSQDRYNAAWLSRELIQNFVDENPREKQSLDGVDFDVEDLPAGKEFPKGGKRFTITGNWKFEKPTGLLSPHSQKQEGRKTAGGNGIGLKQAALRLFRDFGVKKFEVNGEKWKVAYGLTDKDQLNEELAAAAGSEDEQSAAVEHNWLIGEVSKTKNTGQNSYVIETDNPEIIAVFEELQTLGVSKENPYLQNPDFENEHGAIKWLPVTDPNRGREAQERGRLFINGQVMNVRTQGGTSADYWHGPELMTLRLNDVDYDMSIDRPPVNLFDLERYATTLVKSMNEEELIGQLKKSEHIWTQIHDASKFGSDRPACFVLVEELVEQLHFKRFTDAAEIFGEHFEGKPYLALDRVGKDERAKLLEQGYILCPEFFSRIGMPLASSKMERRDKLAAEAPDEAIYDRRRMAIEKGMDVYGEELPENIKSDSDFLGYLKERLAKIKPEFEILQNPPNTVRVIFPVELPENLLFHQLPRPRKNDDAQELLYFIRGVIAHGLKNNTFREAHTAQTGYFSNYKVRHDQVSREDILLVRHVEEPDAKNFVFEFTLSEANLAEWQRGKKQKATTDTWQSDVKEKKAEVSDLRQSKLPDRPRKKRSRLLTWGPIAAAATLAAVLWTGESESDTGTTPRPSGAASEPDSGGERHRPTGISDTQRRRNLEKAAHLPGLDPMLDQLRDLARQNKLNKPAHTELDDYTRWRQSNDYYGNLISNNTGYLGSDTVVNILADHERGIDVASASPKTVDDATQALADELQQIANSLGGEEDRVEDFNIVTNPDKSSLAQLAILRTYLELTTDLHIASDIFIFEGKGALGVNLGKKAIGVHVEMLKQPFFKAMGTFVHENAHSNPRAKQHGNIFIQTQEALFSRMSEKLDGIAERATKGQPLSSQEKALLDLENQWDLLRQK